MKKEEYPLKKLHAYTTDTTAFLRFTTKFSKQDLKSSAPYYIKPDRFDTIKPGTFDLESDHSSYPAKPSYAAVSGYVKGYF
jgi:exopolyphosphatase / guanosine-5'-triphosphate,3'-diphosphate pyrophosphatase